MRIHRKRPANFFESRTQVWREVGLGDQVDRQQVKRARGGVVLTMGLIIGVMILFSQRHELFPGLGTPVRVATVAALVILGWALARALATGAAPALMRRLDPATAGTVGFFLRLLTLIAAGIVALRVAGLDADSLAVGGAFTAVILGLAAQQTLGNLFAGLVLLSVRPFRVGERVRLQGGPMAGQIEGIAGQLGLFYTTLVDGADRIMIPNGVLLQLAVVPIREPDRVELRARFDADVSPADLQDKLDHAITVPTRHRPHISLEELDRDEVVVKIQATPRAPADGAKLAEEVLAAVRANGRGGEQG
jgi:small conductance mechanosensitive channel